MNTNSMQFRSKNERETEVKLERNYGEIGIAAIAAASSACRTEKLKARQANDDARLVHAD